MDLSILNAALDLQNEIDYHDDLFFKQDTSEISDGDYDLLKLRLQALLEDNKGLEEELLKLRESTNKGVALYVNKERLTLVDHHRPFPSLRRTYDFDLIELYKKTFDNSYYFETKLDGLAVELIYAYGRLQHVLTKGTESKGESITHNKRLFKSIPEVIESCKDIPLMDIRAEAHLTFDDIEQLKESTPIKKQRNQVSGWLRSSEPCRVAIGMITLSAYDVSPNVTTSLGITTGLGIRDWLSNVGFNVPAKLTERDLLNRERNKKEPFDGYLMKANKLETRARLHTNDAPLWQMAFKYNTLFAESTVVGIAWSVNKTQITPKIIYSPVNIDGSVCQHANLFTAGKLKHLKIGVGDKIRIVMSGDCVPHLEGIQARADTPRFTLPEVCPCCNSPTVKIGPNLVCSNPENCAGGLMTVLKRATGIDGLDIKGLGIKTLEEWVGSGVVKNPLDIFHLEQGTISDKLYSAIQAARRVHLGRFIYTLCIDDLGVTASNTIAAHCVTIEQFLEFIKNPEQVKSVLSNARALQFLKYVGNKNNQRYIERYAAALQITSYVKAFDNPIPVVLTGGFVGGRNFIAEMLAKHGIEVLPKVTKEVKVVLVGKTEGETSSTIAAKTKGIKIIYIDKDTSFNKIIKDIQNVGSV